jgi:hypothetical protein
MVWVDGGFPRRRVVPQTREPRRSQPSLALSGSLAAARPPFTITAADYLLGQSVHRAEARKQSACVMALLLFIARAGEAAGFYWVALAPH